MRTLADAIKDGLDTDPSSMMIYGESGTGKTLLAGSLSKKYKIIYFDLEGGIATLASPANKEFVDLDNIVYQPVFDTAKAPLAHGVAMKLFNLEDVSLCQEHGKQKCKACDDAGETFNTYNLSTLGKDTILVWDSGTQLDGSIRSLVYGGATKAWSGENKASYAEWARLNGVWDNIGTMIQACRIVQAKVVMIFHTTESDNGGIFPSVSTRNYASTFAKYFSSVVYCKSDNRKYGWAISAIDGKAVAKNRSSMKKLEKLEDGVKLWE